MMESRNINIDRGWTFGPGIPDGYGPYFGEDPGEPVDLPHDYMISGQVSEDAPAGGASGFYNAGVAHYKKTIHIPAEWENDHVFLRFDGVMMNATVEINGGKVALQHYGYTPFCVDITSHLYVGQSNNIAVIVNPSMQPNSRWYTGAGIFRSVELMHTPAIHIENDGIYGYTECISDEYAVVKAEVTVKNNLGSKHIAEVAVTLIEEESNQALLTRTAKIQIDANANETAYLSLTVDHPLLWEVETPNLYRLQATVTDLGVFKTHFIEGREKTVDTESVLFGVRTVTADVRNGLRINGKTVKLKGGCVHHDNGIIGAVSLYDAEVRRVKKMKEVGFNALRTAHNPPSKVLLEVCDRLGMYVLDEAFDAWGTGKQGGDYNQYFDTDWQKDLTAFVQRDRNHPSVILWSIGNEIPERGGLNCGYTLAARLARKIKALDSSRLVTNGICSYWSGLDDMLMGETLHRMAQHMENGASFQNASVADDKSWEEMSEPFTNGLDVVGYNYMEDLYPGDHELYPERIILGSENYPKEIGKRWPAVESTPYVIGDFTWTAVDYIGEAGIGKSLFFSPEDPQLEMGAMAFAFNKSKFPYRLANDADIDLTGNILPQGYYRSVVFGSERTHLFSYSPEHFGKKEMLSNWGFPSCLKCWNWNGAEGKGVTAVVFSRADEVELLLNGTPVGRKKRGEATATGDLPFTFVFDLTYMSGALVAVGYTKGEEVSRDQMTTVGEAAAISISSESTKMPADGHSLIYAEIEIVDADGHPVPNAEIKLTASCTGAAKLAGFGSANPVTDENYGKNVFTTYNGRLCAVLRSGYEQGDARLTVSGEGVGSGSMTVEVGH